MDAELKIKIGAETVEVTKSLTRLQQQLKTFKDALATATDAKRVDLLNRSIEKTSAIIAGVKSFKLEGATTSLGNVTKGSNQATTALTNLGRVAQDVPFGFIGIANNLNPLLESFQRLRIETGSGKAALQALGSSLLGAGGLGVALSVVSAGISIASVGLDAWTRGFGDNKKAAEDQSKVIQLIETDYDRYAQKLKEVIGIASQEASKVSILAGALGDSNLPLQRRKGIIEELAKISPEYLKNLDAEKSSYNQIAEAVNSYIDGLAKQSELKALLPEFDKIVQRVISAQVELNKLKREGNLDLIFGGGGDQFVAEESKKLQSVIDNGKKQITEARKALSFIAGGNGSLVELLFGKDIKDKEVKVKDVKVTFDPNQFLKENLVNFNEAVYKLDQEAQKGFGEIGKNASDKLTETIGGNFNPESLATKLKEKLQTSLNRAAELGIKLPDLTGFANDLSRLQFVDDAIAKFEKLQGKAKQLGETITNALSPAFDTFFKTLLDGSGNPFKAFGEALKQMIIQLTATIAKALLLRVIMSAINPAGTVGSAVGSSFGAFLKGALAGGVGGIANGGINVGGITGAANVGGQKLVAEVSGTSLKFLLDKTNGSIKRGF